MRGRGGSRVSSGQERSCADPRLLLLLCLEAILIIFHHLGALDLCPQLIGKATEIRLRLPPFLGNLAFHALVDLINCKLIRWSSLLGRRRRFPAFVQIASIVLGRELPSL